MSKKVIKKRKTVLELEPDGFSIHTIELSYRLTKHEFYHYKNYFYEMQLFEKPKEPWMYPMVFRDDGHWCYRYADYGIRIRLEHYDGDNYSGYFLRMIINPRQLIHPSSSYLGIFPPSKESVTELEKAFKKLFKDTPIRNDINDYQLSRIDLCTNIRCNNKKVFREIIRAIRKSPYSEQYTRVKYENKDKKKANRYNKHYIKLICGTHSLVLYDKTYQLEENRIALAYENLPNGVMRFEVQYERDYIRTVEKKNDTEDVCDLIELFIDQSAERMIKHFRRCYDAVSFYHYDELKERIKASSIDSEVKINMLALVTEMKRKQTVEAAFEALQKKKIQVDGLLKHFTQLGISPVPLREGFCAKRLFSAPDILQCIQDGKIEIMTEEFKWK